MFEIIRARSRDSVFIYTGHSPSFLLLKKDIFFLQDGRNQIQETKLAQNPEKAQNKTI